LQNLFVGNSSTQNGEAPLFQSGSGQSLQHLCDSSAIPNIASLVAALDERKRSLNRAPL
jgi:hypothetical protein